MRHLLLLASLAVGLVQTVMAVTVTVQSTPHHPIPSTLWGLMFESGDGGLYAELLKNRAFQKVTPGTSAALSNWAAINGATISVNADTPALSSALPNSLRLVVPSGKTGGVGFSNSGFSGIKVTAGTTYKTSFFYRVPSARSTNSVVTVSLRSNSGQAFGSATATLSGSQTSWTKVELSITPSSSASDTNNVLAFTVDGASNSGLTFNFNMFSLFPPTFKGRANGMRQDLAQALADLKPSFWRFPGGNNLEGDNAATRWIWNATIGPLETRPGRPGTWSYTNTDGLGLYEHLLWCEDLNMEPILGVWAGYGLSGSSVPENQLGPYVQEAVDLINFVIGDASKNSFAARRAALGHPEPFKLQYVEIGNEDFIGSAPSTYTYRWKNFYNTLTATFPNLKYIATSYQNNPILSPNPKYWDNHVYQSPNWFYQNAHQYDSYARDGTMFFEGEYAAISVVPNDIWNNRLTYPNIASAVGEASYMTGLERNSDIVFAAAYAPLIGTPNLLAHDANTVYFSTSYYVQKMFSVNRGDSYLPSTLPTKGGTLHWSVVRKNSGNQIIIKIANNASNGESLTFNLPFNTISSTGTAEVLSGSAAAANTPSSPNAVHPVTSTISTGKSFTYNAPALSFTVITLTAS
ncbi:glycoside hydrolase family 51 protein [Panaeolus papilionaceus]|nr:glycoside hydrolase family 51 protein [Panaeolus papilionaceus]